MPNGNPDPNCQDCKGKGKIALFTSSSICDCVNRESSFDEIIEDIGNGKFANKYTEMSYENFAKPEFKIYPKNIIKAEETPEYLSSPKQQKAIRELEWSAEQIADGITTWHMWPGICGVTCRGCSRKMNVLGMSYNHWCPLCDPDGKEYVMHSLNDMGMTPHDNPVFGPSIHTIYEGVRIAEARRKK